MLSLRNKRKVYKGSLSYNGMQICNYFDKQKLQLKKMSFATHSQFSFFSLLPLPCNLKNLAKKSEEEYPMFLNEGLLIFATSSGFFIM